MYNPVAEINLTNLHENCLFIKSLIGKSKLFPVVKANAYGHGLENIAKFLGNKKIVDGFCVATENEAIELNDYRIKKPIFILGKTNLKNFNPKLYKYIIPTVHSMHDLKIIKDICKHTDIRFQVKFDTGMGRLGICIEDINKVILEVKGCRKHMVGCWSHFSSANESTQDYTNLQILKFNAILEKFKLENFKFKYIHVANSSAIFQNSSSYYNLVRPGLSIYGICPLGGKTKSLKPVMRFKLPLIKKATKKKGENIGYNRTYKTREGETIGIFQGGYADGVSTVLNNCGLMKINNQLYAIRGKVSMDLTAVDISNSDIKINDYGIIWGKDELLLENISKTHGKMPYEFLVNLSDRVERKYIV